MNPLHSEWLVVFIIHDFIEEADLDNTQDILNKEILATGIKDQHCFLLIYKELINKSIPYQFTTTIKKLNKDKNAPNKFIFDLISDIDFDFDSRRSWEKLFSWINLNFPSDYICLNTLSHGAGFGILSKGDPDNVKFGRFSFINKDYIPQIEFKILDDKNFTKDGQYLVIKDADNNCKTLQTLWIAELNVAILSGFEGRQVDILLFNNCYMQSFETGYLLKDSVRYLIAPEPTFTSLGYNYSSLLTNINNTPSITPKDLVKTIIPDLRKKWLIEVPDNLQTIGLTIMDLTSYASMKTHFDQIASVLVNLNVIQIKQIIDARQKLVMNVSSNPNGADDSIRVCLIDIIYFFQLLDKLFPNKKKLSYHVDRFLYYFELSLIDRFTGDDFIKHDSNSNEKYNLNGISIFLPFDSKSSPNNVFMNCAYFGTSSISNQIGVKIPLLKFVNQTKWDEFIKLYLKFS